MLELQVSRSNYTNYRQTYNFTLILIIIPVGRNCIGRFGYGSKLLWAEMSSDHPNQRVNNEKMTSLIKGPLLTPILSTIIEMHK